MPTGIGSKENLPNTPSQNSCRRATLLRQFNEMPGATRWSPLGAIRKIYANALEVLENTFMIALLRFGVSRNTASATRTINITYSTIVWPFSFLANFLSSAVRAVL